MLLFVSAILHGCAATYDCGRVNDEPEWHRLTIEPREENKLLAEVWGRRRTDGALNALSTGLLWYRSDDGRYLLCIPPENRKTHRGKEGCLAERYVLRKNGSEFVLLENNSYVCT
jgi:hypothetical protein